MVGEYTPIGPNADFEPLPSLAEAEPGFSEYLGAAGGNVLRDSPLSSAFRMYELMGANNEGGYRTALGQARDIEAPQAAAKAAEAGVTVDFGTGRYTQQAVDIMIDRAKRRQVRDSVIASYDPSMGLHLGVTLLTSLADPVNIGAAFIPFAGEARYGALLAGAAGFGGRQAVRAGMGAIEGFGGSLVVEPLIAGAALQEGRDYTMADSLRNLMFGTALGTGLHASGGVIAEKLLKRTYGNLPVQTPADIVTRIPEEINEAAFRGAISDMVMGRPVAASEVIDLFMKTDPEAARSISYAATLRRDGPDIEDTLTRVEWWKERLAGKPSKPASPDFMSWLRDQGGVRDPNGILEAEAGGKPDLPPSVYIGSKGSKRTQRGMTFQEALAAAKAEGFVEDYQQFIDALRAGQRSSPLRKVYKVSEEKALAKEAEDRAHMNQLLTEAGVSPNANRTVKARAIVGREQHLIAAERARIDAAVTKMLARNDEYKNANDPSKLTPPKPFEPEPIKAKAAGEAEPIAAGDTVNITSTVDGTVTNAAPMKVTRVLDDPVYGSYAFFEGSQTGFPVKDLVRVGEPAARTAPDATAKAPETPAEPEKPKKTAPDQPGNWSFEDFAMELKDAFRTTRGNRVSYSAMRLRLPGLSSEQMGKYVKGLINSEDVSGVNTDKTTGEKMIAMRKHMTAKEKAAEMADDAFKVNYVRGELDKAFPGMAEQRTYYFHTIMDAVRQVDGGMPRLRKYLNSEIEGGRLRAFDEETGQELKQLDESLFHTDHRDNLAGVLLVFKNKADPWVQPERKPSRFPDDPTPEPEATNVPPPPQRVVETPPADVEALNTAELDAATAQYGQLRTDTERRLAGLMNTLPPETAAGIKAQLAQIEGDAAKMEEVYNSAVTCLLKPIK